MYYYLFILAIAAERLVELVVSGRNADWSVANGGKEFGRGHYPVMVAMHTLLLVSCVVEVVAATEATEQPPAYRPVAGEGGKLMPSLEIALRDFVDKWLRAWPQLSTSAEPFGAADARGAVHRNQS